MAEQDADYAVKIMNQIKLFGKPIRVNKASYDAKKPIDIGANLFVGSLDESVEEGQLHETFSTFGSLAEAPKVSFPLHILLFPSLMVASIRADDHRYHEIQRRELRKDMASSHIMISKRRMRQLRT